MNSRETLLGIFQNILQSINNEEKGHVEFAKSLLDLIKE
jgi:hypothetical protein